MNWIIACTFVSWLLDATVFWFVFAGNSCYSVVGPLVYFFLTIGTSYNFGRGRRTCSSVWTVTRMDEVTRKLPNFVACLCGSLYSTFKTSFYPHAFHNKRLQTLFNTDQLVRSKATCSFKVNSHIKHHSIVFGFARWHWSWKDCFVKKWKMILHCLSTECNAYLC